MNHCRPYELIAGVAIAASVALGFATAHASATGASARQLDIATYDEAPR